MGTGFFRYVDLDSDWLLAQSPIDGGWVRRGPFLSLGEFVNRRVSSDRTLGITGAIQSAIDKSNLNKKFTYGKFDPSPYPNRENIPNPDTGTNTPGWLTQADVLQAIGPVISSRSDTFRIRSYGEALSPDGQTVTARACCEAIVQRVPGFVDPANPPHTRTNKMNVTNQRFGRRFIITSFRWLTANEI